MDARVPLELAGEPEQRRQRRKKVVQERPDHYEDRQPEHSAPVVVASEWGALFRCRRVALLPVELELEPHYRFALPWVEDGTIRLPTLYTPPYGRSGRGWRHRGTLEQGVYEAALWRALKRRVGMAGDRWPELRLPGWSLENIARAAGVSPARLNIWRKGEDEREPE